MLSSKILAIFVIVAGPCSASICNTGSCNTATSIHERNHYEETLTYFRNPQCKPSNLDKGIRCSAVGPTIEVAGGLVSIKLLFNNPSDHFFLQCSFLINSILLGDYISRRLLRFIMQHASLMLSDIKIIVQPTKHFLRNWILQLPGAERMVLQLQIWHVALNASY